MCVCVCVLCVCVRDGLPNWGIMILKQRYKYGASSSVLELVTEVRVCRGLLYVNTFCCICLFLSVTYL